MKYLYTLALLLISICLSTSLYAVVLAERGKARATIVVGADAVDSEKFAANELADYLKQITGADFTVKDSPVGVSGTKIYVGQTRLVKRLLPDFSWSEVNGDGIVIKTVGSDLVLSGDRPRGTIYAVYTFLEDYLGVRWWAPDATYVPRKSTLRTKEINITYKPPFVYRETFFRNVMDAGTNFPIRLKLNGHYQQIPNNKGGHYSFLGFCHTFYQLLPVDRYAKDHPEWYALVNGKRKFENAQMCLTNPEMKAELLKNAFTWIEANPAAGIISISQNDATGPCECDNCKAMVAKTGSESGALIAFVNSIAEEIEKKYPDFLIETLAYQYTRKAPTNIKPRKNVLVRLCTIECDFAKPLEGPTNKDFMVDFYNWQKITQKLFVWDYVANFTNLLIPMPNYQVLKPNIQTFAKNNVIGLFEQGDGYNAYASMAPLRTWMISHLMWNPKLNEKKLMGEFLRGYYGKAGPYLEKYVKVWENALKRENGFHGCGSTRPYYMNASDYDQAFRYFRAAEESVKNDPIISGRLQIQRLALDHGFLICRPFLRGEALQKIDVNTAEMAKNFVEKSVQTGNDFIGEQTRMDDIYKNRLIDLGKTEFSYKDFAAPSVFDAARASDRLELQDIDFTVAPFEHWAKIVKDPQATDGSAVRESTDHVQWVVQIPLKPFAGKKGELFVSVRVEAKAAKGKAFTAGIYDPQLRFEVVDRLVKLEELPGKGYYEVSLGEMEVKPDSYIYVAPCRNPDEIAGIYIDRAYLIPSK